MMMVAALIMGAAIEPHLVFVKPIPQCQIDGFQAAGTTRYPAPSFSMLPTPGNG